MAASLATPRGPGVFFLKIPPGPPFFLDDPRI